MAQNQNNNIPTSFQQCVFNAPLTVASNLRFKDYNGDLVTRQFVNDYISNIGANTSNLINQYNQIISALQGQETAINTLTTEVEALQTSGNTIPNVSGGCFTSGSAVPITTQIGYLTNNSCAYNNVLDTTTNIALSVLKQGNSLSSAPSYGNPGTTMSNIAGWVINPSTLANAINNLWLTVLDLRGGMSLLYSIVTPTCSQVIVNCVSTIPSFTTGIQVYFAGYTFIPAGFTDNGSYITVTDSAGNTVSHAFNVVTASTSGAVTIPISGTGLLPNSNYTLTITANTTNSTWQVTCQKTLLQIVTNTLTTCPTITAFSSTTTINFILTPLITTNVVYTVSLLSSGMSVLQTTTITNPAQATSGSFGGLTALTAYYLRVVTTLTGQNPVTCATQAVSTTS